METENTVEAELFPYPFGSPRDILTALFRQKYKFLMIFMVTFLAAAGWIYSQPTLYDAHSTLVLKFGREHIFRPEVGQTDQIIRYDQVAAVEAEREILKSRDLARRVVESIGVENLYPELLGFSGDAQPRHIEGATSKFLGNLESETTQDTNLIEIIFLHERPKVAAQAVNILVEFLKERHLQVFSDPKAGFLVQRLKEYEKNLEDIEITLRGFKQKHDLSSPLEDQQRRLLDQRANLDSINKTINNELQGLVGKIASLEVQMKTIPKHIPLSTTEAGGMLAKAKAELFNLRREEQGLLTKYTENSAPVQNVQKEIELIEEFIRTKINEGGDKSVTSGKNPVFQNLEVAHLTAFSELKTLKARNEVILSQIRDLDGKIQRLDTLREQLVGLVRTRATAEENYKLYVKKVEEAKVSEEMDALKMSNISVIQSADVPQKPAGRPKHIKLLVGTIFGVFMGVGLALVFEYFTGGYTRPDQAAEDLGLPVLASFSQKI